MKNSYKIYDTNSYSQIVRYGTYKSIQFKRGLHASGFQGPFKRHSGTGALQNNKLDIIRAPQNALSSMRCRQRKENEIHQKHFAKLFLILLKTIYQIKNGKGNSYFTRISKNFSCLSGPNSDNYTLRKKGAN